MDSFNTIALVAVGLLGTRTLNKEAIWLVQFGSRFLSLYLWQR